MFDERRAALSEQIDARYWDEELGAYVDSFTSGRHIVGGGAKNGFLNALTAQATGKEIVALPIEATARGNLKIQMERSY